MARHNRAGAAKSSAVAPRRQPRPNRLAPTTSFDVAGSHTDETPPNTPTTGKSRKTLGRKRSALDGAELRELDGSRNIRVQGPTRKDKVAPAMLIESARTNLIERIQEHVEDEDDNKTDGDEEEEALDVEIVEKPRNSAIRSRSFGGVAPNVQALVYAAQMYVSEYTLFTNPFLSSTDVLHLLREAWNFAQDQETRYEEASKESITLVSRELPGSQVVQSLT